jgi:hypothetical protein
MAVAAEAGDNDSRWCHGRWCPCVGGGEGVWAGKGSGDGGGDHSGAHGVGGGGHSGAHNVGGGHPAVSEVRQVRVSW